jgi:hypothetical protein
VQTLWPDYARARGRGEPRCRVSVQGGGRIDCIDTLLQFIHYYIPHRRPRLGHVYRSTDLYPQRHTIYILYLLTESLPRSLVIKRHPIDPSIQFNSYRIVQHSSLFINYTFNNQIQLRRATKQVSTFTHGPIPLHTALRTPHHTTLPFPPSQGIGRESTPFLSLPFPYYIIKTSSHLLYSILINSQQSQRTPITPTHSHILNQSSMTPPPFSPVPSSLPDLVGDHDHENDQTISDFNDLFDFDGFASDVCLSSPVACGTDSSPTLHPQSQIGPLHHLGLPLVLSDPPLLTLEVMLSPLDLDLYYQTR